MRDGLGNVVILAIIVVFLVFATGYMAFNVNYTKAFKMKNKIIYTYEKYNGVCSTSCSNEIQEYADKIGYKPYNVKCSSSSAGHSSIYCAYKREIGGDNGYGVEEKYYYNIVTYADIRIPIVEKTLNLRILSSSGSTKTFPLDEHKTAEE